MGLIYDFSTIVDESISEYEQLKSGNFKVLEETGEDQGWKNLLALGDNGRLMKTLLREYNMAGKIQMIYIDPPFFTKANYDTAVCINTSKAGKLPRIKQFAYEDTWEKNLPQYLKMLCIRLLLIRDLLSDTGTVWIHLDWHASHYVRILMDEIFGHDRFVNEIIWNYKSGGSSKKHFARKHDNILVYSKDKKYLLKVPKEKSYNRGMKPYRFKGVKEYQDEAGWYTMVNMKDVWTIDMVGRTSAERTGYATQKPQALLERIIQSSTEEGDICADFFCGSGTLAAAAQRLNRRWICCDSAKPAVSYTMKRIISEDMAEPVSFLMEEGKETEGQLRAEVESRGRSTSGKEYIQIKLTDYRPDLTTFRSDREGEEAVSMVAAMDPLQLIDYWSVDTAYDGKVYRPCKTFVSKNGKLDKECICLIEGDTKSAGKSNRLCIKVTDVLGNMLYQEVVF